MRLLRRRRRILFSLKPFLSEVGLECGPGLCRWGFVLLEEHLVLCEHLAMPHLGPGGHRLLGFARRNPAVGQQDLEAVKRGEIGSDARCGVPWRVVSVGFVFVFLRRGHLDGCFLAEMVKHCEDR